MFHKFKFLSMLVVLVTFFIIGDTAIRTNAMASEKTVFEDGSYCITTIATIDREVFGFNLLASSKTKSAEKYARYYSADGKMQFVTVVRASFSYDGNTAKAISSNYGHSIIDSVWSFIGGSSTCNGNSATATCTFSSSSGTRSLSATISCSPTGTIF